MTRPRSVPRSLLRGSSAALLLGAGTAFAGFTNPHTPPFRGSLNTEYSGLECFTVPVGGANLPDDPSTTSDDARITQIVPGAILTSTCNIYNPAAASEFVLEDSVPRDLVGLVLQLRATGTTLDLASPTLHYVDGGGNAQSLPYDAHESLAMGEDLFAWDLTPVTDEILGYSVTWAASGAHMSLDAVLLDTRFDAVGEPYCQAEANSTGEPGELAGAGSDFVADNELTLVATSLPPNQFGYLLNSAVQGFVQHPGGSQGNLCLAAGIGRHTSQVANSGPAGAIDTVLDLTALPRPSGGPVVVQPGETWNFQLWYRDVNPTPTSNFTRALSVTFQ